MREAIVGCIAQLVTQRSFLLFFHPRHEASVGRATPDGETVPRPVISEFTLALASPLFTVMFEMFDT